MTFYRFVHFFVTGVTRLLWRVRIVDVEPLPEGACILAPTHRSMADIPLLACVTKRRIRYMGKREVFRWPVIGPFFPKLGAFPVDRDGDDRAAVKLAVRILTDDGEPLAVYPEGTRGHGPEIQPLQPGAAYLAIRAGVPIVPVGIAGAGEIQHDDTGAKRRWPRWFTPVVIVVGAAVVPPDRGGGAVKRALVDELTGELHTALQGVTDEAYRLRRGAG